MPKNSSSNGAQHSAACYWTALSRLSHVLCAWSRSVARPRPSGRTRWASCRPRNARIMRSLSPRASAMHCLNMGNPMFQDSLSRQKALRSLSRQRFKHYKKSIARGSLGLSCASSALLSAQAYPVGRDRKTFCRNTTLGISVTT